MRNLFLWGRERFCSLSRRVFQTYTFEDFFSRRGRISVLAGSTGKIEETLEGRKRS